MVRCLESIVNQSYSNLEIIIVNDGSTDNSGKICDDYEKRDSRIHVIHKNNGGLSEARNVGMAVASGDYISFVDSDDWINKNMIQNLYKACVKYDSLISCCGRLVHYHDSIVDEFCAEKEKCFSYTEAWENMLLRKSVDVAAWDKLFHRSLILKYRFPKGEINEDAAIMFDILKDAKFIIHTGTNEYNYIKRLGSITQIGFSASKMDVIKHDTHIENVILNNHPELSKEVGYYCWRNILNIIYLMESSGIWAKEHDFYFEVKSRFDKYFSCAMKNPLIEDRKKIISLLIKSNLYGLVFQLKGKLNV